MVYPKNDIIKMYKHTLCSFKGKNMTQKRITSLIIVIALLVSPALQAQQGPTGGRWFGNYSLPSFQRILNQGQLIFEWIKENPGKSSVIGAGAMALIGTAYLLMRHDSDILGFSPNDISDQIISNQNKKFYNKKKKAKIN